MIYLYIGEDSAYIKTLIKTEINKIEKEYKDIEVISYSAFDDLLEDVLVDAASPSFGGERKCIVFDKCFFLSTNREKMNRILNHDLDSLMSFLDDYDGMSDIFFITAGPLLKSPIIEKLKKVAKAIRVDKLKDDELFQIAGQYFSKRNIAIDSTALNELVSRVKGDYGRLVCELQKLENVGTKINVMDVVSLVNKPFEDNVFNLTTFLLEGKRAQAISLYRDLLSIGNDPHQILAIMASQFSFSSQVCYYLNQGQYADDIANILKCHPYRVKVTSKTVSSFKPSFFYKILNDLYFLDRNSKIDGEDLKNSLEIYIVEFKYNYLSRK